MTLNIYKLKTEKEQAWNNFSVEFFLMCEYAVLSLKVPRHQL